MEPNIVKGYLVISRLDGNIRTYACTSLDGLKNLILHLTGTDYESFSFDSRGLPRLSGISIADGLHIYT